MSTEKFESWGIVELFGHQQIAGRISEASIGGCSFVRVDVPNAKEGAEGWAYTRYFGQGAIYALNPTSKEVAMARASTCQEPPFAYEVNRHVVEHEVTRRMGVLTAPPSPSHGDNYEDDDGPL